MEIECLKLKNIEKIVEEQEMELKSKVIDDKKFMWDGRNYENEVKAKIQEKDYSDEGFETRFVLEDGKHHIYTRRIVTEIVVEGEAPQ